MINTQTSIFIFSMLLFFISFAVIAENLSITVLEKGTGNAIEGATVVLDPSGDYDITNSKGFVSFEDIETYKKIKVLSIGHETLEQNLVKSQSNIIVFLYPVTVQGDALEVVADRIQQKTSKIILVDEELKRIPGTAGDPLKVLSSLPGVVAGSGQRGPGALYVRGSGADDNGVFVNRIPIPYLFHFGDLSGISPSTINPSLVKDFNAFLGGFPVEYEDKLGGMLDVKLRNPKKDRIHQTYRVAFHESALLVEGPISEENDDDSFYIAGRMSYLDRILTPKIINKAINGNADEEDKSNFTIITLPRYYDAQANWHRNLNKGFFDLYFFAAGDSLAANLSNFEETDPELIGDLSLNLDFQSLGSNWLHRINNQFTLMNTLSIRNYSEEQQIGTDRDTGQPFFVDVNTTTGAYSPELLWRMHPEHELTVGGSLSYIYSPARAYISARPSEDNTNRTFTGEAKYPIDTTIRAILGASYIKHLWHITPKLETTLGLRYTKGGATGGARISGFSPRGSIQYQISENLLLLSSWGKYLQRPEDSTIVRGFGNPDLEFTEAEHRIIGAEYQLSSLWKIKLEAYHKPMKKLVLIIPDKQPPENYKNLGEGEAYGVDMLIKREFSNRKMGWLSYSYAKSSRTTVQGLQRGFTGDQPHTLNLVWSQPMSGSWKRWSWGIKLTAHSGVLHSTTIGRFALCVDGDSYANCDNQVDPEQTDSNFSHWIPNTPKQNNERLPFYYLMSVRFDREIRFNTWKMNIFMDIQNLTFRKNIIGYNYGKRYEKISNREAVAAFYFPLPLLGIEAEF